MMPVRTFKELENNWDIFSDPNRDFHLFLLYSQHEKNISKFVRENFYELDRISGHNCFIFLIEQPPSNWNNIASQRSYWKRFNLNPETDPCFLEVTPYERAGIFDIAAHFGLKKNDVPCVVIFKDINQTEAFIYKLNNEWSDDKLSSEFRRMFDILSNYSLQEAKIGLSFWDYLNRTELFLRKVFASPISIIFGSLFMKYAPDRKL